VKSPRNVFLRETRVYIKRFIPQRETGFLNQKIVRLIKGVKEENDRKFYLYCRFAIKKRFDYSFKAPGEKQKVVYEFSLHRDPVFLLYALGENKNTGDKFETIDGTNKIL